MIAETCSIPLALDPDLPQRDLLLDANAMAQIFAQELGAHGPIAVDGCERLRATYDAGHSLRVAYRVQSGERSCIVAGRTFPAGACKQAYAREKWRTGNGRPFRPVFRDATIETIFWTFPNDRKIANLHLLVEMPESLARLLDFQWRESRVVAYAPEKCATCQFLDQCGRVLAYAKIYADDYSKTCFSTYEALSQSADGQNTELHFPRVVAHLDSQHILILQALKGRRMADLYESELLDGFKRLGRALGLLHGLPVPRHLPRLERFSREHLQETASTIGFVRPDLAGVAWGLYDELSYRLQGLREPDVFLHGDVHPKNGILLEQSIALIDLDQAACGPSAADLGSLLAALRYERHTGEISEGEERELADAFLSGYQSVARLPEPESLRRHMAAALFGERCYRAVRRIRPRGLLCLHELLLDAKRVMNGSDR